MAEENTEGQEKTEEPTARRLEKAREEGQIVRSRELTTWLMLLGGIATLWLLSNLLYGQLGLVMERAFVFDRGRALDPAMMLAYTARSAELGLRAVAPLFVIMVALALMAPIALGGWAMSAKSLQPKFSKLNPLKGLKRIFSTQALAELVKVIAKAALVGTVAYLFLSSRRGELMALMDQSLDQALASGLRLAALGCALIAATLIVVAMIDVPYQIWTHRKKLRMSKEELKRELKESDGDPHVKARIRSVQQSMARRRMMSKVPEADVIVTNPTHYAVALRYDQKRMAAPVVVAKGMGAVAEKIKALGREHKVPMLEAPPLARALHAHVDLDQEIPAPLYTAVAEVLAWAFSIKSARFDKDVPPAPANVQVPDEYETPARGS